MSESALPTDEWDDFDPEAGNRAARKKRRGSKNQGEEGKRRVGNSELQFEIRQKLNKFMSSRERPWNNPKLNKEAAEHLKGVYAQSINQMLGNDIFELSPTELKDSITNGGKNRAEHLPSGMYGIENDENSSMQVLEKQMKSHLDRWKKTPPDFRREHGIIQTDFEKQPKT